MATDSGANPDPDQSSLVAEYGDLPVLDAQASRGWCSAGPFPQEVTVVVGQRIFVAGILDSCTGAFPYAVTLSVDELGLVDSVEDVSDVSVPDFPTYPDG
ncbi:MAG: hypothetical protein LH630_03375, partial [Actinomycetia bacterium]|nr:hypothetical protein [Actinomycetes bacterium]